MANHAATAGLVKIGSDTIGELRSYSLSQSVGTIEDTTLGDTSKTYKAGQATFSGSCEMFWDEADAGQTAITIGAVVVLNLYPEGSATSATYATGSAIVTEIGVSGAIEGMIETSFSFTGTGALTWGTV